jgi:hypothetical protein
MVQMKGRFLALLPLLLVLPLGPSLLGALEVDKTELESSASSQIIFINYEGPHSKIESRQAIRNIGYQLGLQIKAGALKAGEPNRYFVVHSIGDDGPGTTPPKALGADIFGLGTDVGVDHIRNLRLIVQGYLEGAYDYSVSDAALLAEFITVYNAVNRGNWNYFSEKYTPGVLKNLSADKAGLSIRFDEWPGRAEIVIPLLTAQAGSLSAVNTTSITEKPVVQEMQKTPDKALDQRKEMVALKEKEAAQAQQTATVQREAIAAEEAKIAAEKAAIAAEKAKAAATPAMAPTTTPAAAGAATTAPVTSPPGAATATAQGSSEAATAGQAPASGTAGGSPTEPQAKPTTPATEASSSPTPADLQKREAAVAQQEAALAEKKAQVAAAEALAQQKQGEVKADRALIAQDQQQVIAQQEGTPKPQGPVLIGFQLRSPSSPLGRLVRLDAASGRELKTSSLNTVNGRTLTILADRIIAVAGEAKGSGAIRLVQLNPDTLEMTKQGENDIAAESLIWKNNTDLYAITVMGGMYYLGRFDTDLILKAQSTITVHPYGTVYFQGQTLVTQRTDGTVATLNPSDLTELKAGSPKN